MTSSLVLILAPLALVAIGEAAFGNSSKIFEIPGLEVMASDKYPHFTTIETVSRTKVGMFYSIFWERKRGHVFSYVITDITIITPVAGLKKVISLSL